MGYECKRCGAYYESQLKGRCHVHLEHGIAWKRTRKELRVVGLHEQLPVLELLPSELKKGKPRIRARSKRVYSSGRSFKETAFAIGKSFAHQAFRRKNERKERGINRKQHKTRLIKVFAYKGYLKDLPIFGLLKLDQSGRQG